MGALPEIEEAIVVGVVGCRAVEEDVAFIHGGRVVLLGAHGERESVHGQARAKVIVRSGLGIGQRSHGDHGLRGRQIVYVHDAGTKIRERVGEGADCQARAGGGEELAK